METVWNMAWPYVRYDCEEGHGRENDSDDDQFPDRCAHP